MKDEAVSAVVGVLIALSVTIIIASILASFAAGAVQNNEFTPSADISVYSFGNDDNIRLFFDNKGGDKLNPSDIKVTVLIKSSGGEDIDSSFLLSELTENSIWSAGEILSTGDTIKTANLLSISSEDLKKKAKVSTPLAVRMYHVPSSVIIYKDDIILEET